MLISMADVDMCVKEHYDLSYGVQIDIELHTRTSTKLTREQGSSHLANKLSWLNRQRK